MKKIYLLLIIAVAVLSFFVGCDNNRNTPTAITITLNSGVVGEKSMTIESIKDKEETLPAIDTLWKSDRYTFLGWSKSISGSVDYTDGAKLSSASDITLYAQWSENPRIVYKANGGVGEDVTQYCKNGSAVIASSDFTKDKSYVAAWNTNADGSGVKYNPGDEIKVEGNITLYAIWEEGYIIKYFNGDLCIDEKTYSFDISATIKEDDINLSEEGKELYWNSSKDGKGTIYDAGSKYEAKKNISLYAFWQDKYENLKFTLDYDHFEVAPAETSISGAITIPSTYKGKTVIIGTGAFKSCTSLTTITIAEGITEIGESAFEGCTALSSVTLPNTLTTIGKAAFESTGLISIDLPSSVSAVREDAFKFCSSLNTIKLQNIYLTSDQSWAAENAVYISNGYEIANGGTIKVANGASLSGEVKLPKKVGDREVTSIADSAFADCTNVTKISIPDSIRSIGKYAFNNCRSLKSITVPNNVTEIGAYAFNNCISLVDVKLSDKLTVIENYLFSSCTSLKSISLTDSVETINANAFSGCSSLESINLNKVTKLESQVFSGCKALEKLDVPSTLVTINTEAFKSSSLKKVYIDNDQAKLPPDASNWGAPESCVIYYTEYYNVENGALSVKSEYKSSLPDTIILPDIVDGVEVTALAEEAFSGYTSLKAIDLPDTIVTISAKAFSDCTALETITLREKLYQIYEMAFDGCSKLDAITIPSSVTLISGNVFKDCSSLKTITINKAEGSITGAPWGAVESTEIIWTK